MRWVRCSYRCSCPFGYVPGLLVLGQNSETELLWLVSDCTVQSDSGDGAGVWLG